MTGVALFSAAWMKLSVMAKLFPFFRGLPVMTTTFLLIVLLLIFLVIDFFFSGYYNHSKKWKKNKYAQ